MISRALHRAFAGYGDEAPEEGGVPTRLVQLSAALLAVAAGALHFYVMPEHLTEYWAFGLFFLLVGLVQVAGGIALALRRSLRLYYLGLLGTLTILGIYVASRTVGLPLRPHPGEAEPIGPVDLASKVVEVLLVLSLSSLIWGHRRSRALPHVTQETRSAS